ncbi:MAG TPA: SDR family oxidoreductase [Polyangiaceae bacterium]
MATILIAGAGYVGAALGQRLAEHGHVVYGLRRDTSELPASVRGLAIDLQAPRALAEMPNKFEYVFYTAAPDATGEDAYRATYVTGLSNVLNAARTRGWPLRHVFFSSSTAVYAQNDGQWVDEESQADPSGFNGLCMIEAEARLFSSGVSATSVRFGGIYGPGRTSLLERVARGVASYAPGAPTYTNRIHRDDCAGVLAHLLSLDAPQRLYLAVDDEPVDTRTLVQWLAAALGAPPPRESSAKGAPTGRGASNKRCSNARLRSSGYALCYPTFREGYAELVRARLAGS